MRWNHGKHLQPGAFSEYIESDRQVKPACSAPVGNDECGSDAGSLLGVPRHPDGEFLSPRYWLGKVIGRFVNRIFYNDKPAPHNMSTIPTIRIADERDFETEKEKLKQMIVVFQRNGPEKCSSHPHPFFGKFTPEQWGIGVYKHLDHHLRQFGV